MPYLEQNVNQDEKNYIFRTEYEPRRVRKSQCHILNRMCIFGVLPNSEQFTTGITRLLQIYKSIAESGTEEDISFDL